MKTKGTFLYKYTLTIAGLAPKSGKTTKTGRVSKPKNTEKVIKKRTFAKSVPAKGLEQEDDEDESELDLENELEEEDALNELAEKSHPPEQPTEEDVIPISRKTHTFRRTSSKALNPNPTQKLQFTSTSLQFQQIVKRNLRKKPKK
jgi:hypothetical protein